LNLSVKEDTFYWAALSACRGLGAASLVALADYFGGARELWTSAAADVEGALKNLRLTRVTQRGLKHFEDARAADQNLPERLADVCARKRIDVICLADARYPRLLRHTSRPPLVLYVRGVLPELTRPLAMVGSRRASEYGLRAAEAFGFDLAGQGVTIISGGALGVDAASHRGALQGGGNVVAVLGCGVDVFYPAHNRALLEEVCERGAVVSEFPPGTPPVPMNFPQRNRIIAGMSRGVLVVEAAKKSGAMLTVDFALDEGREVFCVPGNIFLPTSAGCHSLIKRGAALVDCAEDILAELWPEILPSAAQQNLFAGAANAAKREELPAGLSPEQTELMKILSQPQTRDALIEAVGITPQELAPELLELQLRGLVCELDGARYVRVR